MVLDISIECVIAQFIWVKSVMGEKWGSIPEQIKIVNEVGGEGAAE